MNSSSNTVPLEILDATQAGTIVGAACVLQSSGAPTITDIKRVTAADNLKALDVLACGYYADETGGRLTFEIVLGTYPVDELQPVTKRHLGDCSEFATMALSKRIYSFSRNNRAPIDSPARLAGRLFESIRDDILRHILSSPNLEAMLTDRS